jgi:hypothetical protein
MKKITILTLAIIALFSLKSFAQKQSAVLLFDYKKSQLTEDHRKQLKAIYEFFKSDSIAVKIDAYCDSVGGPDYNLGLGDDRARNTKQFFLNKKVKKANIQIESHGVKNPVASNATEEGRKINRRVVVEVWSIKKGALKDLPKLNEDSIKAALIKQYCTVDTTVELPNGVFVKMNRCEFASIKNCISIGSYSTPVMLRKSGYTTMGPEFTPLISTGIVAVKLCNDSCLTNAMKIMIPAVAACEAGQSFNVWKGYSNKYWNDQGEAAKMIVVNGKEYYELETKCSLTVNFATASTENSKFTFKAKKGLKFTEIRISYDCGMGIYQWESDKAVKKTKIMMPCPKGDVYFEVYGVTKDGTSVRMDYTAADKIKSKGKQKLCKGQTVAKKFYFFPSSFQ